MTGFSAGLSALAGLGRLSTVAGVLASLVAVGWATLPSDTVVVGAGSADGAGLERDLRLPGLGGGGQPLELGRVRAVQGAEELHGAQASPGLSLNRTRQLSKCRVVSFALFLAPRAIGRRRISAFDLNFERPVPSPIVAFVGPLRLTANVSFGSSAPSDSVARNVLAPGNRYPLEVGVRALDHLYPGNIVTGNVRDTVLLEGGLLTTSATLPKFPGAPWRVRRLIVIDSGATLAIAAGDTVAFDDSTFIQVGVPGSGEGALNAVGTATEPILWSKTRQMVYNGRRWAAAVPPFPGGFTMARSVILCALLAAFATRGTRLLTVATAPPELRRMVAAAASSPTEGPKPTTSSWVDDSDVAVGKASCQTTLPSAPMRNTQGSWAVRPRAIHSLAASFISPASKSFHTSMWMNAARSP